MWDQPIVKFSLFLTPFPFNISKAASMSAIFCLVLFRLAFYCLVLPCYISLFLTPFPANTLIDASAAFHLRAIAGSGPCQILVFSYLIISDAILSQYFQSRFRVGKILPCLVLHFLVLSCPIVSRYFWRHFQSIFLKLLPRRQDLVLSRLDLSCPVLSWLVILFPNPFPLNISEAISSQYFC